MASPRFRKWIFLALFASFTGGLLAADQPTPQPTVIPRALPLVPKKKPGLLQRVFGNATPALVPFPKETATSKPSPKPRKRAKSTAAAKSTATATPTDSVATDTPAPAEASTPAPGPEESNPGLEPLPELPPTMDNADNADNAEPTPTELLPTSPPPATTASATAPLPTSLPPLVGGSVDNSDEASTQPTPAARPRPTAPAIPRATPAPAIAASLPSPTPIPADVLNNPLNRPIPLIEDSMALQITPEATPDPEKVAAERAQFQKVKAKALEDARLQELKDQSERAATAGERNAALKEYYSRLFASMRKIDGTLAGQIDEMEAAARRRLERMQNEVPGNPPPR